MGKLLYKIVEMFPFGKLEGASKIDRWIIF